MRCISVMQPYASLIVQGTKDIENRSRPFNYTGPLLIHASKKWSQSGYDFITDTMGEYIPWKDKHAFGAIIGVVDMIDCVDQSDSEWFLGDWGFVFENAREFKEPIPWRGQLWIFDFPDSLLPKGGIDEG